MKEANIAFKEYYYRIVEAMETLGVESEAVFLSDLFDKRQEVTTFLYRDLFRQFQNTFAQQSAGKNDYQKILLTSAWYAICFERSTLLRYHYKQRPLLGLPFMISKELIKLAYYINLNEAITTPVLTFLTQEDQTNNTIRFPYDDCIILSTKFILYWMEKFQENFFKTIELANIFVRIDQNPETSLQLFLGEHIKVSIDD